MKTLFRWLAMLGLALGVWCRGAEAPSAAGHWDGEITLPGTSLGIRVDLDQSAGAWLGTIDIPVQNLRGFKLGEVKVRDSAVSFRMPGIPGEPAFAGTLAADGESLAGTFTQGGQSFPFRLVRKPRPAASAGETPSRGLPGRGLEGYWQGSLKPSPALELRLVLHLTNAPGGGVSGAMTSVDQGGARIPLTRVDEQGGLVRLEAASVRGVFEGRLSADGSELAGDWRQGGGPLPLSFKRLAGPPVLSRPQEPGRPFPYEEEEVVFDGGAPGVRLAGTFTRPRGGGPFPAVVLISGSGPQDRDEAILGHRPFLVLADHLTRQGIAVLRHDDRGVARSSGDFAAATHEDFVADGVAAVGWLRGRREVNAGRIGLVGHSEGGLVAPIVAVRRPEEIGFLVLLAGVGVPVEELLIRQARDLGRVMGADEALLERGAAAQRETFKLLREPMDRAVLEGRLRELMRRQVAAFTSEQRATVGLSDAVLEGQLQVLLSPWFRALIDYDPGPTLRRVRCPVLALHGAKDLQVAAQPNLVAIAAALRAGGNDQATVREFPGLNHLFQTCATGAVSEYGQIEETFAPAALNAISDWIRTLRPGGGKGRPVGVD